jgi:hypothetical protein
MSPEPSVFHPGGSATSKRSHYPILKSGLIRPVTAMAKIEVRIAFPPVLSFPLKTHKRRKVSTDRHGTLELSPIWRPAEVSRDDTICSNETKGGYKTRCRLWLYNSLHRVIINCAVVPVEHRNYGRGFVTRFR